MHQTPCHLRRAVFQAVPIWQLPICGATNPYPLASAEGMISSPFDRGSSSWEPPISSPWRSQGLMTIREPLRNLREVTLNIASAQPPLSASVCLHLFSRLWIFTRLRTASASDIWTPNAFQEVGSWMLGLFPGFQKVGSWMPLQAARLFEFGSKTWAPRGCIDAAPDQGQSCWHGQGGRGALDIRRTDEGDTSYT